MLAGCSSVPKFENTAQSGDALVRCENGGIGSAMSADAFVSVEEIDGARTSLIRKGAIYHVRPGKHQLALVVRTITMREARQYLEFDAAADRKYRLSATRKDRDFIVELADDTDPKGIAIVTTVKMKAALANILPIPIPIK